MLDKSRIKTSFSRAAIIYDAHASLQQQVARTLFTHASQLFPTNGLVLDAGCGTGVLQRLTIEAKTNWQLIQLDIAPGMCAVAQTNAMPNTLTVTGDIEAIPLTSNMVDGIFSSLALQWIDNPLTAFQEFYRVLKKGHYLAFTTFGDTTLHELRSSFLKAGMTPSMLPFSSATILAELIQQAGFIGVNVTRETLVEYYPDTRTLLKGIKAIGANKANSGGFPGKHFLNTLETCYQQNYRTPQGLPTTWEVLTLIGRAGE